MVEFNPNYSLVNPHEEAKKNRTRTATRLMQTYNQARQQVAIRAGRESQYGSRSKSKAMPPVWLRLADELQRRSIADPEGFVAAQFGRGIPVMPNQLLSERAFQRYEEEQAHRVAQARSRLLGEMEELRTLMFTTRSWFPDKPASFVQRHALRNSTRPVSVLLRYCVAVAEGLVDVAEELHEQAIGQYLRDPNAYDKTWTDMLPASFAAEARTYLGATACQQNH